MARIRIKRKAYKRKGYVRDVKSGTGVRKRRIKPTKVRATSYMAKDTGKPGRTPKAKRWYKPTRKLGWDKDMPQEKRLRVAVTSRPKDWSLSKRNLSAFRALNALANVTTDKETEQRARKDAAVLRRRL